LVLSFFKKLVGKERVLANINKVFVNSRFGKQQQQHLVLFFFASIILPHNSIEEKQEEKFQI
jgi:hypothetical protein